ncbi:ketohexokinase isoform X1 [Neodiprion pinetum]|uniref:Ketohexokinase isoform X1 n=2 Tax=Neodiprion lecontei TaxID=441921 RepID=A0ABM3FDS2_NEOLC|nr:ketohexokinase-like isoform X1 [Neodiprion pinetum]XP_046586165.1 ketohexokinase isoform X1 [Neodiprion lecontei]
MSESKEMISSFYEKIVGTSPPPEPNEPKILCVGLICLDIVQVCKQFPAEDSDQRCVAHRWQRGGNASNNCTVLSEAGNSCEFLGTLSAEQHLNFLQDDMRKCKINFAHCPTVEGFGCPTSTVILSLNSGSRTILHYNPNLPELSLENFEKLNLEEYSWIHFEGRNVGTVLSMIKHVETYNNSLKLASKDIKNRLDPALPMPITISIELEKSDEQLLDLLPYVDVTFVGRTFAQFRGFDNMTETLRRISQEAKSGATIICAWGDRGAMARTPDGRIVQSPAFPPHKIIDSLGAGDTFTAAILFYLNRVKLQPPLSNRNDSDLARNTKGAEAQSDPNTELQLNEVKRKITQNYNIESLEVSLTEFIDCTVLQNAVTFACKVAGAKIGLTGYEGLGNVFKDLLKD